MEWGGGGQVVFGPGGEDFVPTMPGCACPTCGTWVLFLLQGSGMSENISLKMGLTFAA